MAARSGIGLDTVLRRYIAGYAVLTDFLIEEAEREGLLGGAELQRSLRAQATLLDRLIAAVSEEHSREASERPRSTEQRRAERIERLLAGELIDASGLGYDFDRFHLGALAIGAQARKALRPLATTLDCCLLLVVRPEETLWAWLGSRRRLDPVTLERLVATELPVGHILAIGEPAQGLAGWRLTHRQASAALPLALRSSEPIVRYADVSLLASIMQDDLLSTSLRELYLAPLEHERDGGKVLRETLRAYFAAERNVSSAAVALAVNRQTVTNRLRVVQERLGRPIDSCIVEIETALRLDAFAVRFSQHDPASNLTTPINRQSDE